MVNCIEKMINKDGTWNQSEYNDIVKKDYRILKDLHNGLKNVNPLIREGCAEALGELGYLESVPILIEYVDDKDENVRWDIINSIESIIGLRHGILLSWIGCNMSHRNKIKKELILFWKRNRSYFTRNGQRQFWVAGT